MCLHLVRTSALYQPILMSWLGRLRHFPQAPLVCIHHRRHDSTRDVRHALWDGHQPLTSAGTIAILKSVQSDAQCPVCGSTETWKAVTSGSEQLQQLNQLPLCDGSAHEDEFLGRHRC